MKRKEDRVFKAMNILTHICMAFALWSNIFAPYAAIESTFMAVVYMLALATYGFMISLWTISKVRAWKKSEYVGIAETATSKGTQL